MSVIRYLIASMPIRAARYAALGAATGFVVAAVGRLPTADQGLFTTFGAALGLLILIIVLLGEDLRAR